MTYLTGANPTISSSGVMTGQVNFMFATTSGGAGTLQGVLTFSSLGNGNTQGPSFNGTFQTGSSTGTLGTPILYWGNGVTTNNAALTLNTNDAIVNSNGTLASTTGTPGSGQVYAPAAPPPSPTPEPASILMLGSGLLALGGTIKRRYFR
jgi:hypothetical protein